MILALDLGTRTGWAAKTNSDQIITGFTDFKHSRYDGGGMRYLKFENWLQTFGGEHGEMPTTVYYEEVRAHKGTAAAHVYGGLQAVLTAWCEKHRIPYAGVPVGTIKKHATGKGNCGKQAMIDMANLVGINTVDDNEADAYWLLDYSIKEFHAQ
jgi:hypothetical protein